jgi:hypothetical protein
VAGRVHYKVDNSRAVCFSLPCLWWFRFSRTGTVDSGSRPATADAGSQRLRARSSDQALILFNLRGR